MTVAKSKPLIPLIAAALFPLGVGASDLIHQPTSEATTAEAAAAASIDLHAMIAASSQRLIPGAFTVPQTTDELPRVFAPTRPRDTYTRFPWRRDIVATVFWVGERPTARNPTPNTMSAWDMKWTQSFGGYDNPAPSAREGFVPKSIPNPGQNPFYYALPYNDITRTGTKASARAVIPWFKKTFYRSGQTVLKGRWMAIRSGDRICYAQWEDVGPFEVDDWQYVFGDSRPKNSKNKGCGLDVSPAVRDYLGIKGGYMTVDWRFVDVDEVPDGPWRRWGSNNPFANSSLTGAPARSDSDSIIKVRELRDRLLVSASEQSDDESSSSEER